MDKCLYFGMFRQFWNSIPVVRGFIPLLIGILTAIEFKIFIPTLPYFIIGLLILHSVIAILLSATSRYRYRIITGIIFAIIFFLIGLEVTAIKTSIYRADYFGHHLVKDGFVAGNIIQEPIEKERSIKLKVAINHIIQSDTIINTSGTALVYLEKTKKAADLRYGDKIILKNNFNEIQNPKNPHEFKYKRYLSFHDIYHQAYVRDSEYGILKRDQGSWFYSKIYRARGYFLSVINKNIANQKSKGVASALILGYRELLDEDTIHDFSSTGAMHVLAVSGLHVGIIYLILNSLLKWMEKRKKLLRYLKPFLLLTGIWFYASITGLSPSVTRAATMFSFVIFGSLLKRYFNIYGSILSSAFILLLFNPYLITEIGFLLSYAAVIGIVYIQPKLYRKLYFKNWLADKIWAITCVSIAAQIATFPLGLLYFHQFPVYFIFSNLVVIPAAIGILYGGLLLLVLSPISILTSWIGLLLDYLIQVLNYLIRLIEHIPYSLISGISILKPEVYLIYGIIIFCANWLVSKRKLYLFIMSSLVVILVLSFSIRQILSENRQSLIIYHVPNVSAIELVSGRSGVFISDSTLLMDRDKMLFHIKHNWWNEGIRKHEVVNLNENNSPELVYRDIAISGNVFQIADKKGIIYSGEKIIEDSKINCEWLIICNSPNIKPKELAEIFTFSTLIFDTSNKRYLAERWSQECAQLGLNNYNVWTRGAFIEKIR